METSSLHCTCEVRVDPFDLMWCKGCSKIYHLSCQLNKGCIKQSLRRPHIRILNCNECLESTQINNSSDLNDRHTTKANRSDMVLNTDVLEIGSHSSDQDVSSKPADAVHQNILPNSHQPSDPPNLCTGSDGNDPKKGENCWKRHKPTAKETKNLQCTICKNMYPHECVAYATGELQKLLEKNGWICKKCLDSIQKKDGEKWKTFGKKAAIGAGLTAACLGGIPLAVGALGFGAAGVTAGSLAAAYQSTFLGGYIAAGSTFSVLQSVGAVGLATSTQAGIAAVCTSLPFLKDALPFKKLKSKKS